MDDLVLTGRRMEGHEKRVITIVHDSLVADGQGPREARAAGWN